MRFTPYHKLQEHYKKNIWTTLHMVYRRIIVQPLFPTYILHSLSLNWLVFPPVLLTGDLICLCISQADKGLRCTTRCLIMWLVEQAASNVWLATTTWFWNGLAVQGRLFSKKPYLCTSPIKRWSLFRLLLTLG